MTGAKHVAGIDLGASSGRVVVARIGPDVLALSEVHRFPNGPVRLGNTLHWDVLALYGGVLDGLRVAGRRAGALDSVGIDSWAVDYGLLDTGGQLLGNPIHYRDARTLGVMEKVLAEVPAAEIYATTGVQFLAFNTIYQLVAAQGSPQLEAAGTLLLIPDLLSYWLTGEVGTEVTNASTTQLLDVCTQTWSTHLIKRLGIRAELFAPLRQPGARAGFLREHVLAESGLPGPVPVVAVASHDTGSAVVAVPAAGDHFGFISCGTWSLVGVELDRPVLTEASRAANFTNEVGIDGTIRYLRNVMGLWLLQEAIRAWGMHGDAPDTDAVLRDAARAPAFASLVDPDDPFFLVPGDMPARIAEVCRRTGQSVPTTRCATVRCILESLALAHRRALEAAQELSGKRIDTVHLVGGGSRNTLLCQWTADACGLPLVAGPAEATALGNTVVQGRALGAVEGDVAALRALIRRTQPVRHHTPSGAQRSWAAAGDRILRVDNAG